MSRSYSPSQFLCFFHHICVYNVILEILGILFIYAWIMFIHLHILYLIIDIVAYTTNLASEFNCVRALRDSLQLDFFCDITSIFFQWNFYLFSSCFACLFLFLSFFRCINNKMKWHLQWKLIFFAVFFLNYLLYRLNELSVVKRSIWIYQRISHNDTLIYTIMQFDFKYIDSDGSQSEYLLNCNILKWDFRICL